MKELPTEDIFFMKKALEEAEAAFRRGEIPVGAVIVKDGAIIGRGGNDGSAPIPLLAHAETAAMADAGAKTGARFDGCTIYVTLEPCAMCAGAIAQFRMARLVYGAKDPKAGAAGSLYNIPGDPRMCHRCEVRGGVLSDECAGLLRKFFEKKRADKSQSRLLTDPLR